MKTTQEHSVKQIGKEDASQLGIVAKSKGLSEDKNNSHEGKYTKEYWLNKSEEKKLRNHNDDAYDDYFQNSW